MMRPGACAPSGCEADAQLQRARRRTGVARAQGAAGRVPGVAAGGKHDPLSQRRVDDGFECRGTARGRLGAARGDVGGQTGIVGTFGGINIPPVAIFMQGFAKGVEYYNAQKGASVKVLGWDMAKQDGTFAGNFNNLDDGKNIAKSQADEGADIIFPVAGPVGLGASAYAMESAGKVKIIGVDVDMTQSNPEQAEVYVASVLKKIDAAVLQAVKDALAGQGGGTDYLGTLANGGVGVAITSTVTPELQAELDAITAGIIDGSIATS